MGDLERYIAERNKLLSMPMDFNRYCVFARRWNLDVPTSEEVFIRMFHKARTAVVSLPKELRKESKCILEIRNSESWDDGDL